MKRILNSRYRNGILFLLLFVVSGLVYLPRINQIGYMNDDWYLMYSSYAYGPQVFSEIFQVDRPARALVMIPAYTLFGNEPLYYNLSAYFFRVISAVSFLWLLQMLWPRQQMGNFWTALLFLIYPGFLSQINGIDYQSHIVSLAAGMLSIALSLKAWLLKKPLQKFLAYLVAVLLGWLYLGLMEYFLGLEFLRLGSFYIAARHDQGLAKRKPLAGVSGWLPTLIIPGIFLIWRIFFFESERGATDIGSQLAQFRDLPIITSLWWLIHLVFDALKVIFFAWAVPLYQLIGQITRLSEIFIVSAMIGASLLMLFWLTRPFEQQQASELETRDWRWEALLLGLVTAFGSLVPVILVNREADFGNFSRYTLTGSPGSALVLVSILFFQTSRVIRWGLLSLLIAIALLTHHANTLRAVNDTKSLRMFWWQVSWRIPQLHLNTTLIANYPVTAIQEDYFVWGPANFIYYPQGVAGQQTRVGVSAAVLNRDTLLKVIADVGRVQENRRSIRSVTDYQNVLVLTMPTQESCVQVIDGSDPEISQYEEERVMVIAQFSDPSLIDLNSEHHVPPPIVFGPEPSHGWCYYYEKAGLARQQGDWNEVVRLGNEVVQRGFIPHDDIEWMPFLQAYAHSGEVERLDELRRLMRNSDPFIIQQICQDLVGVTGYSNEVNQVLQAFCRE